MLLITTNAAEVRIVTAEAIDPHLAKRIVEDCCAVTRRSAAGDLVVPVDAVGRKVEGERARAYRVGEDKELISSAWVRGVPVEPNGCRIALGGVDDVCAGNDIQFGLNPAQAVLGDRIRRLADVAAHVPHLVPALLVVVPDTITEYHRGGPSFLFQGLIRLKHGRGGVIGGRVEAA